MPNDLIRGGQGRSPEDLRSDASCLAIGAAAAVAVLAWLLIAWVLS